MKRLFCKICGMEINDNNYNFNSAAFIDKNSVEHIVKCPFCGVNEEYISADPGMVHIDREAINHEAFKIIDHAVKLEIFNGDFYREAAVLAENPENRDLFKALSIIEYTHARVHKNLAGIKEDPKLSKLDYSKYNTDAALLELAAKRELHAVEYYKKYKSSIGNKDIGSIFDALAEVESEHIELTEK